MASDPAAPAPARPARIGAYAWYALFVLVIVYIVNFIDRQILSILVGDIKRDLSVSDAQIGFLYGTAFAVFYALFGIP
ncbi:MAG TPA: MFS transporter, partial [Allosphingosinicella sp.]